jgi:hypothetical protein
LILCKLNQDLANFGGGGGGYPMGTDRFLKRVRTCRSLSIYDCAPAEDYFLQWTYGKVEDDVPQALKPPLF